MRVAYLIPKYPGQTHIFYWREMQAIRELGIGVEAVSTQPPKSAEVVHSWAQEALRTTPYLYPLRGGDLARAAATVLRCGPGAWWRCARAIAKADGVDLKRRLRMTALVVLGARMLRLGRERKW